MASPLHVVDAPQDVRDDIRFLGPDSVSWKVAMGPTYIPALLASLVMFELYQPMAVLGEQSVTYTDPIGRSKRSMEYFYTVVFGTKDEARKVAAHVNAMHDTIKGHWAVTGREYCASEPDNLLWLLVPVTQLVLDAYATYGIEPLTMAERDQMWREQAVTAELNRIPLELFPKSQAEADAYFERMRPHLGLNEASARAMRIATYPTIWNSTAVPVALVPIWRILMEAASVLLPDYAAKLVGQERPSIVRRATIAAYKPLFAVWARTPYLCDATAKLAGGASYEMIRNARELMSAGV
ncbi:oxygenase MpaB family protein [Mycolicibacterium llatzerense]|uniref:oxygenase MpaB family protein n=1 Tax=Mycolicibacterium llatzerense TaxID=280871 RepID=UPI0021B4EF7A|nr:oxygenase MpaB family protein [Mycolicibacterium llatzerense]MCT7365862.1 hypothetical protein [Mycolicibacterium llatzerense]